MKQLSIVVALAFLTVVGCDSRSEKTEPQTAAQEAIPSIQVPAEEKANDEEATQDLRLPNESQPLENITAAGQPTAAQWDELRGAGYHTVVNLRTEGEAGSVDGARKALENKLIYKHIPIGGPDDLTKENVDELHDAIVSAEGKGKVLVHCGSSNRVGAMLALRAKWSQGKSAEEALAIGKKAGLASLENAVKAKLEE